MKCAACGLEFQRAAMLALLVDLGCVTSDPNFCDGAADHQHEWGEPAQKPVDGPRAEPSQEGA